MIYFFIENGYHVRKHEVWWEAIMYKKFFVMLFVLGAGVFVTRVNGTCSCLTKGEASVCYLGALELSCKKAEAKRLCLYYDGAIINVSGGVYSFKEVRDIKKLNILFVDPTAIQLDNSENTVYHLTILTSTPYDFYELSRGSSWFSLRSTGNWSIRNASLERQQIDGQERFVIPEHTIIVPLDSAFFKKGNDRDVTFTTQPGSDTHALVHLPALHVERGFDEAQFERALLQAEVCMLNLKSTHAAPDRQCVCMDNHTVVQ